jgi:lipoprotein-releasing system permease protein
MNKNSIPHNREKDSNALIHLWKSPWTSWVGFRYLKSKKNSRFLSFITLLSIMGVGLGVTAMIVVLSVMDGFESELKKRMMSSDLHILVQPTQEVPGFDRGFVAADALDPALVDTILKDKALPVLSFSPVVSTEAILKTGRKVSGIVLKGISDERLARLKSQMVEAAEPKQLVQRRQGEATLELPGIFLGQELAYEMGLIPGDQVTLISPTEFEGPLNGIPRLKRYAIEGIYHSGLPEQELHTVYARQGAVYSFLRKSGVVSQWEITVANFDEAPSLASHLRELAPQFKVQDWVQMNSHLFASLKLERLSMFVILAFIIIVASFNIVTTLTLMVLEKKREISILKAMGARNGQVAAIFLAEGALIGGIILGLLICLGLKRYEFITLPDIYYDRTLPVTFDLKYYVIVSLCALLIVLAACLYPSRRAAKLDPLEGIRFG